MNFTLAGIRTLIERAKQEPASGDTWLDARYLEDIPIIAHTNPYYKLFNLIAKRYRPAFTVELGAYRGTGGAHFAAGNPNGTVLTIDIHREDKVAQVKSQEADAQYPNLTYINAWTLDAVPAVKAWDRQIDVLFIDAWHHYKHAMDDWNAYEPLLASPSLVICDDIFDAQGATIDMVKFWTEISEPYESMLLTEPALHHWVPMGFMKYER